jgi:hypothetical protein
MKLDVCKSEHVCSVPYIEGLDEVGRFIMAMDFSWQKYKMVSDRFVTGWSMEKLDFVEKQYKGFLFLWRKYPELPLPPPFDVDDFWHGHLLHTARYFGDCNTIFGKYRHHYPYFGMRGLEDRQSLEDHFIETQRLYKAEFGDWIRVFREPQACATQREEPPGP